MEARRVAYVFGFQLRGSIPLAQSQYLLFILMFDFSPVLPLFSCGVGCNGIVMPFCSIVRR
jgi:hypothetical protein